MPTWRSRFTVTHYQYTVERVFTIYGKGIALVGFVADQYSSFHFTNSSPTGTIFTSFAWIFSGKTAISRSSARICGGLGVE
jgi:hypothetical protein